MDAKDRLYFQSSRQQKLTLRRRCRSETLPHLGPVTIVGHPIELDDINDLRRKAPHHQTVIRSHFHAKHQNPNIVLQYCIQRIEKYDCEQFTATINHIDVPKRRVRTRSESEPQEIYLTKTSPKKVDGSGDRSKLVLKRSRENKSVISKNRYADSFVPSAALFSSSFEVKPKISPKSVKNSQFAKSVNNYLCNRPSTPCNTPRYSVNKSLNGSIRKLRSKSLRCKSSGMVVVNPVPQRCATPENPDDESNHTKDECEEDSDGGSSSLEDDVDFGDASEEDFNDSFSDLEDNNSPTIIEPPNLNKKLSETNLLIESVMGNRPAHGSGPLAASLFPHVPPYINFADHIEKGSPMPAAVTKTLKWKLTTITPIVIRKVLANTGFRLLKNDESPDNRSNDSDDETNDWMGVWGKHMKSPCFKTIRSYQKINHIPGSFQIGRKDRIWRNLQIQMTRHGKKEFGFMPRTFVIPADLKQLHRLWPTYSHRNAKWIIKPPASARGTGIKVVNQWSQIPKRKPLIVQSSIEQEAEPLNWMFWRKRRYIVVLLAFLGYLSSYSLRVNLSVAIVTMSENRPYIYENGTEGSVQYVNWNSQDRGLILSSFYWGYIMTQFVGGIFAKRFGGNLIFGIGIGVTAVLSILTPWLGKTVTSMIVIRVLQGLFGGVTYPCIHDIWFYWAPIPERSRMASIAYAGMFIGTVVTMPASAYLATYAGWESVFYVFGGFGVLWHIVWIVVVRSSPDKDRFISKDELRYIQSTVSVEKEGKKVIPWISLLTSKPVLGITAAQFALNWGYNTMLTQMPTFLADTLNYDLGSSGFLSGAPYLTMGILVSIAGYLDMLINRRILSITQVRKFYVCVASVIQTICMALAGFFIDPVWSVVLIIISVGAGGFSSSGYSVNALDIAPDFASIILGFSNTVSCLTGIVSPLLTGILVQNKTIDEWRIVFYITAGIYILGCIVYWFWCSGKLQSWSHTETHSIVDVDKKKPQKMTDGGF